MSDRLSLAFLSLLIALIAALPAAAQKAPQAPGTAPAPTAQKAPQVLGTAPAPTTQEDQEPQPEPPKSVLQVDVKDSLLSVELENVPFGSVIKAVAEKAGFRIEGSGEVFSRKLNTKFTGIEVERGVLRLLTLVKESNYMLHYDTKGLISKLEIFGIGSGRAPSVTTTRQPLRRTPALRQPADSPQTQSPATVAPIVRRRVLPSATERRQRIPRPDKSLQPAAQPSDDPKTQTVDENNAEEEPVAEIPYVTPQPRLAPAPVR
jgi:hypothetical protein